MARAHCKARAHLHQSKIVCRHQRDAIRNLRVPQMPEPFCQLAGINRHRARGRAKTIHRARIQHHVREIAIQRVVRRARTTILQPLHLAPHHDALPRRQRQVAARALRLAIAALDALVHLRFHHRHPLQVGHVRLWIGIDDHARIEQVIWVGQLLQPLHHRVSVRAPLGLNKRRHVAARAVLRLQRAIVLRDY